MNSRFASLFLGCCLSLTSNIVASAEEALTPDFLEFLGEGEKVDGVWVDPFDAEEAQAPDKEQAPADQQQEKQDD